MVWQREDGKEDKKDKEDNPTGLQEGSGGGGSGGGGGGGVGGVESRNVIRLKSLDRRGGLERFALVGVNQQL